ncbi:CRISPR-associated endonuclease Cas2 [Sediminibacterium sp.]|uniref:CRISPR-associated endonuclease Cas2 n=1 Tax=Sediminibacterium sp. TaxID=1917865 RepID=UPI002735AD50|nr:CRISPR-associated endonuclease Cas2 [Sediminibacterium sp.]
MAIYDISDNNTRNNLIKCLQHYGLHRVQKSSFIGNLSHIQREKLEEKLDSFISGEKDSIYLIPICDSCREITKIFSKEKMVLENHDNFRIL